MDVARDHTVAHEVQPATSHHRDEGNRRVMFLTARWKKQISGMAISLFLLGLTTLGSPAFAVKPTPFPVSPGDAIVPLDEVATFALDASRKASAIEEFAVADGGVFQPIPGASTNFGFSDATYWFHVRLQGNDPVEPTRILRITAAGLDEIDVFQRQADGSIISASSGDRRPFTESAIPDRYPNFLIKMPYRTDVDVLVRVRSADSIIVPMTLYTPKGFFESDHNRSFGRGIYAGILLMMFGYNLILFVTLRDRSRLWFAAHIASFGLMLFFLSGMAFEYVWPIFPALVDFAAPASLALAMMTMHQFARTFLELKKHWRLGDHLLNGLAVAQAVIMVMSLIPFEHQLIVQLGMAGVLLGVLAIAVAVGVAAGKGHRPAVLLLTAWSVLLIGLCAHALVAFGVTPMNPVSEFGMQAGLLTGITVLSFSVVYRYGVMRNETEQVLLSARTGMKHRVAERTKQLAQTMAELADVNVRLRESSHRDGLTGVYNRRFLDANIDTLLSKCRIGLKSFSVLVADIDYFKRINDEAGHLTGDDCLRTVASVIQKNVPDDAVVARFGGEEFVILLPETDERAAIKCAETIRLAVAACSINAPSGPIRMTISIGVSTARPRARATAESLLRRADDAMYCAKREGRNRVMEADAVAG